MKTGRESNNKKLNTAKSYKEENVVESPSTKETRDIEKKILMNEFEKFAMI